MTIFGKSGKLKYTAVSNPDEPDTVDIEPMKQRCFTPGCFWSSLFTSVLIGTYYIPSIALTFYQRWFYQSFHFPLITVICHMCVKYLLAVFIRVVIIRRRQGAERVDNIPWKDYIIAVAPTGIFSGLDIALSNWGLELVTVSLYTMTKTTTIIFILFFSILLKLEKKSWSLCGIVGMITLGLMLFTYKSSQFNFLGFFLLLLASIASGIRWTCVQLLLQKSKMGMRNPVDMIYHMQPWMIGSVVPFALWMEGANVFKNFESFDVSSFISISMKILLGAFIAFFMEFSEVTVVTYTSSLTLAIAGILKEVMQLVLAVEWNGDEISLLNVLGLCMCLCGIVCHVIHKIRSQPMRLPKRPYEFELSDYETEEQLVNGDFRGDINSASSEDEKSDTDVLFDILNRHERNKKC